MAYSTITTIRNNLTAFTDDTIITDAVITHRITLADNQIQVDLSTCIDFTDMPDIGDSPATPAYINLLSIYKATEYTLVYYHGAKRNLDQVNDITYYRNMYNELLEKIKSGEINLGDYEKGSMRYSSTYQAKPDIAPAFGEDKYGEYIDDDDLADLRPLNDDD